MSWPPTSAQPVARLDTYGSWIDGRGQCDSWHHSGRAFDLAGIRLADGGVVSCRYDQWRDAPAAEVEATRRAYWAVAAGLHLRFAYVLTYLYNARHANHIHLDNGRSGPDLSTFRTRSRVQVQAVQAMLTYLWAEPVELTGRWDGPTQDAARRVGDQLELARRSGRRDRVLARLPASLGHPRRADPPSGRHCPPGGAGTYAWIGFGRSAQDATCSR